MHFFQNKLAPAASVVKRYRKIRLSYISPSKKFLMSKMTRNVIETRRFNVRIKPYLIHLRTETTIVINVMCECVGKELCQKVEVFYKEVLSVMAAYQRLKTLSKKAPSQMFSCEFCETFQNFYFARKLMNGWIFCVKQSLWKHGTGVGQLRIFMGKFNQNVISKISFNSIFIGNAIKIIFSRRSPLTENKLQ